MIKITLLISTVLLGAHLLIQQYTRPILCFYEMEFMWPQDPVIVSPKPKQVSMFAIHPDIGFCDKDPKDLPGVKKKSNLVATVNNTYDNLQMLFRVKNELEAKRGTWDQ